MRFPPIKIQDFDIDDITLQRFCKGEIEVISESYIGNITSQANIESLIKRNSV